MKLTLTVTTLLLCLAACSFEPAEAPDKARGVANESRPPAQSPSSAPPLAAQPARYLTAPNAGGGDPALCFEIGADGKVSLIHVGTKPVIFYVEGCA